MYMNLKNNEIRELFNHYLVPKDAEEIAQLEAKMIMAQFLSEIETVLETRRIRKRELASMIGTSASFITQLFRGNKIINLVTIAKIKIALNLNCEIKVKPKVMDDLEAFDKHIGSYLSELIQENNQRYSCLYKVSDTIKSDTTTYSITNNDTSIKNLAS